jgi:protein gp37
MYRAKARWGQDGSVIEPVREATINNTLRKLKRPSLIFVNSLSDFFIPEADAWRERAWEYMRANPQHQFQILTKLPHRIIPCLPKDWGTEGYDNVWLGVSVESDEYVSRIIELSRVPAAVKFISVEPMLSRVHLLKEFRYSPTGSPLSLLQFIDWVIVGGESGNTTGKYLYRPCAVDWIHSVVTDCRRAGKAVFVKQLGTHLAKALNLKHKKGGDILEWPEFLRVREFPDHHNSVNTSQE